MKKGKVFFHPIEGAGSLTISWSKAPKGDAIESKHGNGVGFFSSKGELLCVIFDEVQEDGDHQFLRFAHHSIEVMTKKGNVSYKCTIPPRRKPVTKLKIPRIYNSTRRKRAKKYGA
jgi:hypothetical protein